MKRPWLGAKLQAVTPEIAETLGLKRPTGALVANVAPNSPAARAGLKTGDLIVAIDGQAIDDPNAFDYRFATRPLGGTAQIDVQRAGKTVKLTVAAGDRAGHPRDEIVLTRALAVPGRQGRQHLAGARRRIAARFPDRRRRGDRSRRRRARAASVGFQKGDIILAVNDQKIAKTSDLDKASQAPSRGSGASSSCAAASRST